MGKWTDKVNKLKQKLVPLEIKYEELSKKVKPIEDEIERLKKKATPTWKRQNKVGNRIYKLKDELEAAEAEAYIENLKVGDRLWIEQSWIKGQYETTTEEQAKTRMERRAPGSSIPHLIEITDMDNLFAKEVGKGLRYMGKVVHWRGRAQLRWRRTQ